MAESIGASSRFEELNGLRTSTLDRAELCAELTIPYLFRDEAATAQDDLSREYVQGFGAKLVNHLVGKFAISILPPSQPFYRLSATSEALDALAPDDNKGRQEIERILATKEDGILRYINQSRFRGSLYPALRLAMVTGDSLIEKNDDGTFRVFNMRNYVVLRDFTGRMIQLIIKETLTRKTLPEGITVEGDAEDEEDIYLYTVVQFLEGKYELHQEIEDEVVGIEASFNKLSDRFIDIRWSKIDDENHGRSFVEEHLGTLISLNKLLKVVNESAVVSAKTVFTVNPNGMTKYKDLVNAANGQAIIGQEQDVGTIKVQKASDLQAAVGLIQDYKKELSEAFLMGSAAIRDAERVTKAEVQLVASELEASFGGVFTAIAEDIQIPLIEAAIKELKIDGANGSDEFDVIITSGVEALGRNIELSKINNLIQELQLLGTLVGAEVIAQSVNVDNIAAAMVANSGVAGKNFLLTEEEKNSRMANQKQEEIAKQAVLSGVGSAASSAGQQQQQ